MSFADVMKAEKNGRRRGSVTLCFNSDLDREYRELEVELEDAVAAEARAASDETKTSGRRVAEKPRSHQIAAQMKELREVNADAFYEVSVQALPRAEWLQLRAQHPPRDSHKDEDGGAFNSETFPPAAAAASLIDPEPTEDVLAWLEANLTSGDWNMLGILCWGLNEGTREAPKEDRASSILSGNANG
jgi:hypothetical protein